MYGISKVLDGARVLACVEAGLLVHGQLHVLRRKLLELAGQVDGILGPELAALVSELAVEYADPGIAEQVASELLLAERKHWIGKERELQRARDRMRVYRRKHNGGGD